MSISLRVAPTNPRVLLLQTPYHPALPPRARELGGSWDGKARVWVFDRRDEARVRALVQEVFGVDPMGSSQRTVTVRLHLGRLTPSGELLRQELWLLGRRVAARPGRDMPVQLGPGVVLVEGRFTPAGGTRRYPEIGAAQGVVLEVRDVPEALVQSARPQLREALEIVEEGEVAHCG
jgi:hypothetical protein